MDKQFAYIFFGIQFLGAVSVLLGLVFLVGFSGGLDLIGYDFPGFSETLFMLPMVVPFTALIYAIYPRMKNQTLASLLLMIILVSNAILAIQILRMLRELVNWFV